MADLTCVQSVLQQIRAPNFKSEHDWNSVEERLTDIQAFLNYVGEVSTGDEAVREHLEDLVCSIKGAFETAGVDIDDAVTGGDAERLAAIRSSFHDKLELLEPRVRKAYHLITGAVKKQDPTSVTLPSVDSALEMLMQESQQCLDPEWTSIRVGLELIQTFLTFVPKWSDTNEVVRDQLGDLMSGIEDAFGTAGHDVAGAIRKGDSEILEAVRCKLFEKIEILKLRIVEAYGFLSEYAFQTSALHLPVNDHVVWIWLCYRVLMNAWSLYEIIGLSTSLYAQMQAIVAQVLNLGNLYFIVGTNHPALRDLLFCIEGVPIGLAHLLFLWWVEETDIDHKSIMLLDLVQRIKPTSPELLECYLTAIFSHEFPSQESQPEALVNVVEIALFPSGAQHQILSNGLRSLVTDRINGLNDSVRSKVVKVVCSAASLNYSSVEAHELFQLFKQIVLLQVEIVLPHLTEAQHVPDETLDFIYQGLSSLQAFLKSPESKCLDSEKLVLIFKRLEQVVTDAHFLQLLYLDGKPGKEKGLITFQLQLKVKLDFTLLKIQAFLMELVECNPTLMVSVDRKIHMLDEGLEVLLRYSSAVTLKDQSDTESLQDCLRRMQVEGESLYDFFQSNQVSKRIMSEMSLSLQTVDDLTFKIGKHQRIYPCLQLRETSAVFNFPKAHYGLGFVDLLLERLHGCLNLKPNPIGFSLKRLMEAVNKELHSLRSSFEMVGENTEDNAEMKGLCKRATEAAYEADYIVDRILTGNVERLHSIWLSSAKGEMEAIKSEVTKFIREKNNMAVVQTHSSATVQTLEQMMSAPEVGEAVISLEVEENDIISRLTRGISRIRDVVTISGMPGIGKTTLAQKVYADPRVKNHFRKLAWCCVSQVYQKRGLLLKILSDVSEFSRDEMDKNSDDELLNMLYKALKGKRYLVVMDDVWSIRVWEELRNAFTDDNNGSRILITTRDEEVGLKPQHNSSPLSLRPLTKEESWRLLLQKVFHEGICPPELQEVGLNIAEGCKGLPLSIVAIAGILKMTEKSVHWWKHIEKDLHSRILENPEIQCMRILELSYDHLPCDLKPCFLYFAAFREDDEVPVQKLIQLWIAEGFVRKVNLKLLEDVAESYVMNLVARSLLMVAKKGSSGRVKACRIHDMLHKLCLAKVEEEDFLHPITGFEDLFPSSSSRFNYDLDFEYPSKSVTYQKHRLSIHSKRNHFSMLKPSGPPVRTLLFFAASDTYPSCPYDVSFIPPNFELLRVLDIESINIGFSFPAGIELLHTLRYLAVSGDMDAVPDTIVKLWNLQVFIVKGLRGKVTLPDNIWGMKSLRHLHVRNSFIFRLESPGLQSFSDLDNLVTLSAPVLLLGGDTEAILKRLPKLQKLRCFFLEPSQHNGDSISFPKLDFLTVLQSLKIFYFGRVQHSCQFSFPSNINKLSLLDFSFTWDAISSVGALPKLRVLKLVSVTFDSQIWEMKDDEFQQLEYLKLDALEIAEWIADNNHLPNLKQLVLHKCMQLEEVPSGFGDLETLEIIELKWCSPSAEMSVKPILEKQDDFGNEGFKAFINGSLQMLDLPCDD